MSGMTNADKTKLTGNAGGIVPADGTGNFNIIGSGLILVTGTPLTNTLTISGGGVTGTTNHAVQVGTAGGGLNSLAVGTTGKYLRAATTADPVWSALTLPDTVLLGDILVASANNIVGVVNDVVNAGWLLTANLGAAPTFQAPPPGVVYASDAETIAGTVTNKAVAPSNLKAKLGLQTVHALPIGNGDTLALGWLAVGADNTVMVGNTGADPSFSANPTVTSIKATTFDTNVVAAGTTLAGTTWAADGTDVNIGMTITPKGTGALTLTTGNVSISSGNLLLPTTTSTVGQIQINGKRFAHTAFAESNTFVGINSGNFTLSDTSNSGFGINTLDALTNGYYNCAFGTGCASNLTSAQGVCCFGRNAGNGTTTAHNSVYIGDLAGYNVNGARNIYIGASAGYNATGSNCIYIGTNHITAGESNVLKIGSSDVSYTNITKAYIDGIYNTAVGATAGVVLSDSADQLGGLAGSANTIMVGGTAPSFTATPQCTDLTLTGVLNLPASSSTVGQITQQDAGGVVRSFIHTYGNAAGNSYNIFIGHLAGNFTMTTATARYNTGIGDGNLAGSSGVLHALTTGQQNSTFGYGGQLAITSGSGNTSCGGILNLARLTTGSINTCIGSPIIDQGSGYNYTGAETSNILLAHLGVTGESNVMRLGTQFSAPNGISSTYIAGIYGVTPGGTLNVALVDSNGQLGSVASLGVAQGGTGAATLTDHGVLLGSDTGAITPTAVGATGEILIGNTGADPSWDASPSITGDVTVTNDVKARTLFATGDEGTGVVSQTALTNVSSAYVDGSGVAVIKSTTGAGLPTFGGYLKMYQGTTIIYVPYFTSIS